MPTFELNNNNSGGSFWIGRKEIDALKEAGWYEFRDENGWAPFGDEENYFGTGCTYWELHSLRFEAPDVRTAVESFESITEQDLFALGCTCCGAPFALENLDTREMYGGDYVKFTRREHQLPIADVVEQRFWDDAHYLTPRDAVRIARCLLENVCDADMFDYSEFEGANMVKKSVNKACDALDPLRL